MSQPRVSDRWQFHLVIGVVSLLLTAVQARSRRLQVDDSAVSDPSVRAWVARSREEDRRRPWSARIDTERNVLRALTSLWLSWRCYRLVRRPEH